MLALDPTNGLALPEPRVDRAAPGARRRADAASARRTLQEAEALARKAIDGRSRARRTLHDARRRSCPRRAARTEAIDSWKRAVALDAGAVQRALQPVVELAAAGPARRGGRVRTAVRRDRAAGVLRRGHRPRARACAGQADWSECAARRLIVALAVALVVAAVAGGARYATRQPPSVIARERRSQRPARSPSTRCAPTRSARTAAAPPRRISTGWPRAARASTFAHAHAVVTLPSHASILSGRYPVRARHPRQHRLPLSGGDADAGDAAEGARACDRRVRRRFPARSPLRPGDRASTPTTIGSAQRTASAAKRERPATRSSSRRSSTGSTRSTGKWFAWVHVYDPHAPYAPPPEWRARFPSDPYLGEVSADRRRARAAVRPSRAT